MEGIIKFEAKRISSETVSDDEFALINPWRQQCYDNGYIGVGKDGIAYGNISFRSGADNEFIISASATGGIAELKISDYSRVINFDIANNSLKCKGPKLASSESLSHAAIYKANSAVKAVLHIHNIELWSKLIHKIPTTPIEAEYGTQAMANAISSIVKNSEIGNGMIIMAGHKEGIISYGSNIENCISSINKFIL